MVARTTLPACCVCFESLGRYGGPCSLPCGHNGCLQCMAHVQRSKPSPECPICRQPFGAAMPLVVNCELRDLMQLATALTTVEQDGGWQAVTAARVEGGPGSSSSGDEGGAVALVPSAPPLHVDLRAVLEGTGDLMSLEPPRWAPDSSAPDCSSCHRPFAFLVRSRHHCRVCGQIFCGACSSARLLLPPKFLQAEPQRVCGACAELLRPLQPMLAGMVSAAVQAPVHDSTDWASWRALLNSPLSQRLEDDIYTAVNIVRQFGTVGALKPERGIPQAVLSGCAGLAILSVLRVGAGWGCGLGTGLVVARRRDGSWSPPSSVLSVSAGLGWQLGCELVDVIVVLRNQAAVRAFCGSQLGVGGSASISAGPVGREAAAKLALGTGGGGALCYSYSCSRGAFVGLALEGTLLRSRDAINERFYGRALPAKALLLSEAAQPPAAAATLYDALDELLARVGEAGGGAAQFSVRALPWAASSAEAEEEEVALAGRAALPGGACRSHSYAGSALVGVAAADPFGGGGGSPQRGRERESRASYRQGVAGAQLWHAPSAPAFSAAAWEDEDQALPSLFD